MASLSSRCSRRVGETAADETERRRVAKSRMCKFYAQGSCRRGSNCSFAHGDDELQRGTWHGNRRQSSHRGQSDVVLMRTSDGRFQTSEEAEDQTPSAVPAPPRQRRPLQHLQHTSGFVRAESEQVQQDTPQQLQQLQGMQQGTTFVAPPPMLSQGPMGMVPSLMPVVQAATAQPNMVAAIYPFYPQGGHAFALGPLGGPVGGMAQHPIGVPYQPIFGLVPTPPRVVRAPLLQETDDDNDNDSVGDDGSNTSLSLPIDPLMGSVYSQLSLSNRSRRAPNAELMRLQSSMLVEFEGRRARREDADIQEAIRRSLDDEYSGGYGSQPLNELEIGNLTMGLVFSHASCNASECPICLVEFEDGQNLRGLQCGHAYHESCIGSWLSRSSRCPMCKQNVRT